MISASDRKALPLEPTPHAAAGHQLETVSAHVILLARCSASQTLLAVQTARACIMGREHLKI